MAAPLTKGLVPTLGTALDGAAPAAATPLAHKAHGHKAHEPMNDSDEALQVTSSRDLPRAPLELRLISS